MSDTLPYALSKIKVTEV